MHSLESLREIRALEFFLYGYISKENFYRNYIPKPEPRREGKEKVIGYATFNLQTREITRHKEDSKKEPWLNL